MTNRQSNRQSELKSESKIESIRNRVSIISLLVRGTRIGNYNLHLMGGIYYKCKFTISEITYKQDLVWGISYKGDSLSGAHSQ
jgi:hypothetical protein